MTVILVLLSLVPPVLAVAIGWGVELVRKHSADREFGFWDANVLAAIYGGAVQ